MILADDIIALLKEHGTPEKAKHLSYYFKTGEGTYGEGDLFIGVEVPVTRSILSKYWKDIDLSEIKKLTESEYHEARLVGFLLLLRQYEKSKDQMKKQECVDLYIHQADYLNNWDLVDLSCYKLLGAWLLDKDRSILYEFARSGHLWRQRIAIVTCMCFIKQGDFKDCEAIADLYLDHKEDLIHKATGWMLREVGKQDEAELKRFLASRYRQMPRTMLRYAIEKFPPDIRSQYIKGEI